MLICMKFCSFCFMKLSLGVVQFHYMKASGINVADRIIAIFCKSLTSGERERGGGGGGKCMAPLEVIRILNICNKTKSKVNSFVKERKRERETEVKKKKKKTKKKKPQRKRKKKKEEKKKLDIQRFYFKEC